MTQPDDLSQVVTDEGVCLCGCTENCAVVAELRQRIRSQDSVIKRMVSEEPAPPPAEARGEVVPADEIAAWLARESKAGWSEGFGTRLGEAADTLATLARQLASVTESRDMAQQIINALAAECKAAGVELIDYKITNTRAEQAKAQLAQATARLAAVEGLPAKWRHDAQGCGRRDAHAAGTRRSCARELDAALQPKELDHAAD